MTCWTRARRCRGVELWLYRHLDRTEGWQNVLS